MLAGGLGERMPGHMCVASSRGVAGFQRECVKEQGVAQLAEVGACAVEGLSGLGGAGVGCSERRRLQMYNQK